jgi:hypothetical protein
MAELSASLLSYDVPYHRKSLYSKIRTIIRSNGIMLTYSAYIVPFSHTLAIETAINRTNFDKDGQPVPYKDKIRYSLAKFDSTDQAALKLMVKTAYENMLTNIKESFRKALQKAEEKGSDDIKSDAVKRSRRCLRDMQKLALIFALSDDFCTALAAFQSQIDAEAELQSNSKLPDKEKDESEEIEKEAELAAAE